jgi:catechol 2,3-dioxygenase-like lactoylglutathione lyase family enzyme
VAGKLRHIAISVPDPNAAAAFYEKTFGMIRAKEYDSELADVVYLSDGIHHMGFLVDDVEKTAKLAEANGGT